MRERTPEECALLGDLYARMRAKMRYTAPPPEEAHLYEQNIMDIDLQDGTTVYGLPTWWPIAEARAWQEARFRPGRHEVDRA